VTGEIKAYSWMLMMMVIMIIQFNSIIVYHFALHFVYDAFRFLAQLKGDSMNFMPYFEAFISPTDTCLRCVM
jgi:hypothetical protein